MECVHYLLQLAQTNVATIFGIFFFSLGNSPWSPGAHFLEYFEGFFYENRRRGLARLLKRYRVFILTKIVEINITETFGRLLDLKKQLKFLKFSETLDMSPKQVGDMFEGNSADTGTGIFPLVSMWG